jgi:hypothetical protein
MKSKPKMSEVLTPALTSAVNAYLMARTYAEVMTEKVEAVYLAILTECPVYGDLVPRRTGGEPVQILKSRDLYLCSNEALCQDVYEEANKRLRALKLKPADMKDEFCPALVAQRIQTDAENLLIEIAGKPFGITNQKLLCSANGLKNRQEFIDLNVKLVVSQSGYKNPLTQKAA